MILYFRLSILDWERISMNGKSRRRVPSSSSGNLKSKIQNLKWSGIVAIGVAFATCGALAQAQQRAKIARIGVLRVDTPSKIFAAASAGVVVAVSICTVGLFGGSMRWKTI
jgi:hypothetical protein